MCSKSLVILLDDPDVCTLVTGIGMSPVTHYRHFYRGHMTHYHVPLLGHYMFYIYF